MQCVNVREARERISQLLDAVARGEDVIICRHGKPAAKLVRTGAHAPFPDRSEFRASIPASQSSTVEVIRALRDEERA